MGTRNNHWYIQPSFLFCSSSAIPVFSLNLALETIGKFPRRCRCRWPTSLRWKMVKDGGCCGRNFTRPQHGLLSFVVGSGDYNKMSLMAYYCLSTSFFKNVYVQIVPPFNKKMPATSINFPLHLDRGCRCAQLKVVAIQQSWRQSGSVASGHAIGGAMIRQPGVMLMLMWR